MGWSRRGCCVCRNYRWRSSPEVAPSGIVVFGFCRGSIAGNGREACHDSASDERHHVAFEFGLFGGMVSDGKVGSNGRATDEFSHGGAGDANDLGGVNDLVLNDANGSFDALVMGAPIFGR